MPERPLTAALLSALMVFAPAAIRAQDLPADAPELAPRGASPVGVMELSLLDPDRADILKPNGSGGYRHGPRSLPIEIWYPATAAATGSQHFVYSMPAPFLATLPRNSRHTLTFPGKASHDAAPAAGHFPVLVLSHGYNNRAVGFSHLAENLASKGYVVIAIEHDDLDPAVAGSRRASFTQVLVDRSADQRFVIAEIRRRAFASSGSGIFAHVDPDKLALAGYSMGGYGAIATAGAGYDPHSPLMSQLPGQLMAGSLEADDKSVPGLKALILFGPWGGSPANRMWSSGALAQITVPTLIVDGNKDDIADYATGVRWIFEHMTASDRYLLTYREARHNIAMNAAPPSVADNYLYIDKFDEPVWRKIGFWPSMRTSSPPSSICI